MPVDAEFDDQQGGEGEGDDADRGKAVAEMAPVAGPEVEYAAGDEGKGNGIGARHPLAVCDDLAVARRDESGGGADHPRGSLHGGSGKTRAAGCESDPRVGTDKDGHDVDTAEDTMDLEVTLTKS